MRALAAGPADITIGAGKNAKGQTGVEVECLTDVHHINISNWFSVSETINRS